METENTNQRNQNGVYSQKLRAGRRRTYFFDVRTTRANDYYLTITESKKRFDDDGYERHKIFLYKEDFNKFMGALNDTVNHVKTELMPDYDFDEFAKRQEERQRHWEATNNSDKSGVENSEKIHENGVEPANEQVESHIPAEKDISQSKSEDEELKWD